MKETNGRESTNPQTTSRTSFNQPILKTKEECEKQILDNFKCLKDENTFHNYFCSYDFHPQEKDLLDFWREVLNFIYESLYNKFAISISQILEKTKLRNRRPIGLPNIIQDLYNKGEYILSCDISPNSNYFKNAYPDLYPKQTWGNWLKSGVISGVISTAKMPLKIAKSAFNYTAENDNNDPLTQNICLSHPEDLLINKRLFHHHLDNILAFLSRKHIEDDTAVFPKYMLSDYLRDNNINNTHLELSLNYLCGIKKIELFDVKVENTLINCVKLIDKNSGVTEKDKAIINILEMLKRLDKKISESWEIIQECLIKAKGYLKSKNRDSAMIVMRKKKLYYNAYNHYSNLKMTLEQNLIDIKSMESNKMIMKTLESAMKTAKELKVERGDLEERIDRLKDQREDAEDVKDIFKDYQKDYTEDVMILMIYIIYFIFR